MNASQPAQDMFSTWSRNKFIFWIGVVAWALPCAIIWSVWTSWGQLETELLPKLIIALILFPIAGFFFGWSQWALRQHMQRRAALKQSENK